MSPDNASYLDQPDPKDPPMPHRPFYRKIEEVPRGATRTFLVTVDEGWRQSVVCEGMYEWAADWLIAVLARRPFADSYRPGHR